MVLWKHNWNIQELWSKKDHNLTSGIKQKKKKIQQNTISGTDKGWNKDG